jgi:hypothetical protein
LEEAGAGQSPPHGHSERQIVILHLDKAWPRRLSGGRKGSVWRSGTLLRAWCQELHLISHHFEAIALLSIVAGVVLQCQGSYHTHLASLGQVTVAVLSHLSPSGYPEEIGFVLASFGVLLSAVDSHREAAYRDAGLGRAELRVAG